MCKTLHVLMTNILRMTLMEGLWWDKNLTVMPNCRAVKQLIFHDCHDAATAGHLGVRKTEQHIQHYLMWPNVWAEAEAYVRHCPSCQVNKGSTAKPEVLMQPVQVPPYLGIQSQLIMLLAFQ